MKGKTNQPMKLLVIDQALYDAEAFATLEQQGHLVETALTRTLPLPDYDRIYGHNCYRMTPALLKFLPISLKEVRVEKKGRKAAK